MKARVYVMPKAGVLDPQGKAIGNALKGLGFEGVGEVRAGKVIELELANLVIFLVHLSLGFRTRHDQLNDLYALVRNVRKPCIVAGDFNAFWGDREIGLFLAATGLAISTAKPQPSFPSWKPRRQLDFILHSPLVRITDFFMPQVTYSDHLPLVCDFEIGDQKADKNRV